jgi:hypothetical protein
MTAHRRKTIASRNQKLLVPKTRMNRVSTAVMRTPAHTGMPIKRFSATAEPMIQQDL